MISLERILRTRLMPYCWLPINQLSTVNEIIARMRWTMLRYIMLTLNNTSTLLLFGLDQTVTHQTDSACTALNWNIASVADILQI